MSQRTLLEISHDYLAQIEASPEDFVSKLMTVIEGRHSGSDDAKGIASAHLQRYGARKLATRHHSEDLRIMVDQHTRYSEVSKK